MKLKSKILIHVFFWFYIVNQALFPYYINEITIDKNYYLDVIIHTLLGIINFYPIYFSLPYILSFKNKFYSVLLILLIIALMIPIRMGLDFTFYKYLAILQGKKEVIITSAWWYNTLRLVIITGTYAFLIRLAISWFETQKRQSELILQTKSSELALLRSQVNPHFLFNTLNNIYSLVYRKSEDAPAAVMKMSAIMRYMLYDATTDKVLLDKEIEYLKSFIELEKLRIKHKDSVSISITGEIEGRTIAPMILIPFVENAFKHGSKNVLNAGIRINLSVDPQQILFEVTNALRKNAPASTDNMSGIGLQNIKRRLELLYPGKHTLEINQDEALFHVKLTIRN